MDVKSPSITRPLVRTLSRCAAVGALGLTVLVSASGLASAAPIPSADPAAAPGQFAEQNLGADRTAENYFYRIPALAYLGNNVVLAAMDGRMGSATDAPNPNSIVVRRSTDGGQTWSSVAPIAAGHVADATGPKYGYSDPSFVYDAQAGKIFAFFVYSKDAGFNASVYGNDDANRNVISSAVVESSDGGVTWSQPRLITNVTKPGTSTTPQAGDVRSNFASSGEGIQLKYGQYAGRLIQQYAGSIRQSDGTDAIQAYSVYSDDHGATWHKGADVGVRMDENKVVELSDGRVMLNSRDNAGGGYRKVAISTDGGHSYGPVTVDTELPDPTNNGSITRLFPNAAQGSADAKKILFTNSNSQTGRENVSARISCDDGATWPGVRSIHQGFSAYSTATRLEDGKLGVFYEGNYTDSMVFAKFDDGWLNYVCAPLNIPAQTVVPGVAQQVPVTVTNQEAVTLSGASATIYTPAGWSATTVPVPDLAPGASVTVNVTLTSPSSATGSTQLNAAFITAEGKVSQGTFSANAPVNNQVGLTISGSALARDVVANPYVAGEVLSYNLTVKNTSNVTANAVPTSGSFDSGFLPPTAPNCRYNNLAAGASYTCTTAKHTVTAAEVTQGYFSPTANFSVTSSADSTLTKNVTFTGANVALRDGVLSATIVGNRTDSSRDLSANPYTAGEQVRYNFTVTNTSPITADLVPTAGNFSPLVPEGAGNCRWRSLAAGASYNCGTPRHTVTAEEVAQGYFVPSSTWTVVATGQSTKTITVTGDPVVLSVKPAQPTSDPVLSSTKLKGSAPVDLMVNPAGYLPGQDVTLQNVPDGQWYFVYLEKKQQKLGWFYAEPGAALTATLPADAKSGANNVVVLDQAGQLLSWDQISIIG